MLQGLRDARSFGLRLSAAEVDLDDAWDAGEVDLEAPGGADDLDEPEEPDAEGPAPVQLSMGAWVVSLTKGGSAKTLHKVGACWRRPGVHYLRFLTLDESEIVNSVAACPYNRVCIQCFPSGLNSDSSLSDQSSCSDSSDP